MTYQDFIQNKILQTPQLGFEVAPGDIHPVLLPHQRDCVQWACRGGNRALFESFGLGKTIQQLEIARLCVAHAGMKALIVCPLAVKKEFKRDARNLLGIEVEYVRNNAEIAASSCDVLITNYERVLAGEISPHWFCVVLLDEASVLRSYGSKTYQEFLTLFQNTRYRFVCTATPSPNRFKELIHYAGFLGIMDTGQALTRWFKRDSTKANNLTLYEHKEREFWLWMASWAVFVTVPSDLGYSDEGYDLPGLNVHWHMVNANAGDLQVDRDGQIQAFKSQAADLRTSAKEKRDSVQERWDRACEIILDSDRANWLIWHHLEREREIIERETRPEFGIRTCYGSQSDEVKEQILTSFSDGEFPILATKPEIAGQGCNFQRHCADAIFLGIDYKFNDFIQAIHRIYRYQQSKEVNIHIIYTDAEQHIRRELEAKWSRHYELVANMTAIIEEYGLSNINGAAELRRSIGIERKEVRGQMFTAVNNDCVAEMPLIADNSMGMVLTSIPFSNHYEYTPSYNDFGHTDNDDHFFRQMDYLTPELMRVLQPGRVAAIHVKDRILFGNVTGTGFPTVNPFHAKAIFHYMSHGFEFMGMITIETDVVRENNQTYRLGWTEQCKDGSKMGVGCPEYLLLFRKPQTDRSRGYADVPVTKSKEEYTRGRWQIDARAKWNSSGDSLLTPEEVARLDVNALSRIFSARFAEHVYDYEAHVGAANALDEAGKLPATFEMLRVPARADNVWDDVVRMRTLNSRQSQAREQQHVCPFQLDIVRRAIERWSNPGDIILDPFGGLSSVNYEAIALGRRGYTIELNTEYWTYGVGYSREAEYKQSVPTLFDLHLENACAGSFPSLNGDIT